MVLNPTDSEEGAGNSSNTNFPKTVDNSEAIFLLILECHLWFLYGGFFFQKHIFLSDIIIYLSSKSTQKLTAENYGKRKWTED